MHDHVRPDKFCFRIEGHRQKGPVKVGMHVRRLLHTFMDLTDSRSVLLIDAGTDNRSTHAMSFDVIVLLSRLISVRFGVPLTLLDGRLKSV